MEALGTGDLKDILRIAEIAYGALDCEALGREVLDAVSDSLGVEKGVLMLQGEGSPAPQFFYRGIDAVHIDQYISCYYSQDPLHLLSKASSGVEITESAPTYRTTNLREAVRYDSFLRTPYYEEFYRPQNICHEIAVRFKTPKGGRGVLDLLRSRRDRDFSGREIQIMDCLAPHLVRAFDAIEMRRKLEWRSGVNEQATIPNEGLLLCNEKGKVIYTDAAGKKLLQEWAGGEKSRDLRCILRRRIDDYVSATKNSREGSAFIPRSWNLDAPTGSYRVTVTLAARTDGERGDSLWAILFCKQRAGHDLQAVCRREFGLSRREVEVIEKLFEGKRNAQISQQLFITEFTVKKHIQHICDKLDVRCRTAILSKLSGILTQPS